MNILTQVVLSLTWKKLQMEAFDFYYKDRSDILKKIQKEYWELIYLTLKCIEKSWCEDAQDDNTIQQG